MSTIHRSEFLKELKQHFPELREQLYRQYGLLHLEMHEFEHFVNVRIAEGDKETVSKSFQFLERLLKFGNSELKNAVAVSFLEHLNFNDGKVSRSWAANLMPPLVSECYASVKHYHSNP